MFFIAPASLNKVAFIMLRCLTKLSLLKVIAKIPAFVIHNMTKIKN